MGDITIENARIESTMLGIKDHGIMTAFLHLDFEGSCQGFGGYGLDSYDREEEKRVASKACGYFIKRVLETVGVENWEDLHGKYIRAKRSFTKIHAIGNILEDKWFNPREEFERMFPDV